MGEDGAILAAAAAIARIADDPVSIAERARQILAVLARVVSYDAAAIALGEPERRTRILLASAGDDAALRDFWAGPGAAEPDRLGPAGVGGAVDVALVTFDGRHVGHLTLLTASAGRPTPAERDLLGGLTEWIARAVDRLPAIGTYAGIVRDAFAGAVLTRGGATVPLPGLPTDPVLDADSPVVAEAAERLAAGDAYATFLHPAPVADGDGALLRISVLDCRGDAADHLRAAVLVSPEPDLCGLSRPDLQVLGLVVEGWEDERIAAALGTAVEDVAAVVTRSMHLLAAPSRTGLAVRVLRQGLFLPRRVLGPSR